MQEAEAEEKEDFDSGEGMFDILRITFLKIYRNKFYGKLSQRLYIAEMTGARLA